MDRKIRRNKKSYTTYDIYNNYIRQTGIEVPYARFKRILDTFNKTILDRLLNRSEGFKMPYGIGYIQIVKYKPKSYSKKSLSVDYKASKEEGMRIYHKKFGEGTINKIEAEGDDAKVDINFDKVGHKRLMAKYAGLEIIS